MREKSSQPFVAKPYARAAVHLEVIRLVLVDELLDLWDHEVVDVLVVDPATRQTQQVLALERQQARVAVSQLSDELRMAGYDTGSAPERLEYAGVTELMFAADVDAAVAANAEGVGLFRTEFCFLDRPEGRIAYDGTGLLPFSLVGAPGGLSLGTPVYSDNGGATYGYSPLVSGGSGAPAGHDGSVTDWRLPISGILNGSGAGFSVRYQVIVK